MGENDGLLIPKPNFADRLGWGHGPWQTEPDEKVWLDSTGYPCLILRIPTGALCGYVGIPPGHRYYEIEKLDIPVEVHGGLSFAEKDGRRDRLAAPLFPGVVRIHKWLGFDCAHCGDLIPGLFSFLKRGSFPGIDAVQRVLADSVKRLVGSQVYRDFGYVEQQVTRLAAQLKALEPIAPPN